MYCAAARLYGSVNSRVSLFRRVCCVVVWSSTELGVVVCSERVCSGVVCAVVLRALFVPCTMGRERQGEAGKCGVLFKCKNSKLRA